MAAFRRIGTVLLGLALAALATVTTSAPAQAWTFSPYVTVYNGGDVCVQGRAGIDHLRPGAFSGNLAYADTIARAPGCGPGVVRWAAVRLDVYRWNGSAWAVCRGTNWRYDWTGVDQFGPIGPGEVFDYGGSASCGAGYYGTLAHSYVWNGSVWRGGSVWSGYEFVP